MADMTSPEAPIPSLMFNLIRFSRRSPLTLISAIVLGGAIAIVSDGLFPHIAAAARACEAYSLDHPEIPPWDDFTNCPLLQGNFQNERWTVTLDTADTGLYTYEGSDRDGSNSIYLSSREVRGTEDRPIYTFRNGDTAYTITFRASDHNTIRLEVFQGDQRILNELLTRI
ncbi:MAG: hypothetical protein AAF685_13475 [Cyanobacteria bacterium P01_C01_bin.89]